MEDHQRPLKRQKVEMDDGALQQEFAELPAADSPNQETPGLTLNGTTSNGHPNPTSTALPADPPLSKNALKRLLKQQKWEAETESRRAFRKEKTAQRKQRKRAEKARLIAENGGVDPTVVHTPLPDIAVLPITILIDCDFDDKMNDNERVSLASQITRTYSDNRKSRVRAHLAVASFGGKLRERFDNVLMHYKAWKGVRWLDEDFVGASEKAKEWMGDGEGSDVKMGGVFGKYRGLDEAEMEKLREQGEVVYLSSESNETLTELKPFSTYIVGGLVDKNREKGICHRRATEKGVRTARLPIGDFMDMQSRKVLATNHVNEIMIRWLECGDWGEAFLKVIPKRKGGKLKGQAKQAQDEEEDEDAEQEVEEEGRTDGDEEADDPVTRS